MYFELLRSDIMYVISILLFLIFDLASTHPKDLKYVLQESVSKSMDGDLIDTTSGTLGKSSSEKEDNSLDTTQYLLQPNITAPLIVSSELFFLVLVHSNPANFENRKIIRETWGSVSEIEGCNVKVVFLLGNSSNGEYPETNYQNPFPEDRTVIEPKSLSFDDLLNTFYPAYPTNSVENYTSWTRKYVSIQRVSSRRAKSQITGEEPNISPQESHYDKELENKILKEHLEFNDIIQANFTDNEENSVMKHMIGLKWIQQTFVHTNTSLDTEIPIFLYIKADDNVFIEMYHLFKFVKAIFGHQGPKKKSLVCDVIPSDANPKGRNRNFEARLESINYPEYCNGMAYLMTPDLISDFLKASDETSTKLENDDKFITGVIRERLGIKPFYLNLRYSYDETNYLRWLQDSGTHNNVNIQPLPYLFVKIDTAKSGWQDKWRKLWEKTIRIHSTKAKVDQDTSPEKLLKD